MNPLFGMCFALTPGENYKMSTLDKIRIVARFSKTEKIPIIEVYFTHPEDRYGTTSCQLTQTKISFTVKTIDL